MATTMIESEEHGKRNYTIMKGVEVPQAKLVKRRRRDASLSVLGNPELIQEQDCGSTSPKTVKRSSRFRGVSRHKWTGRYEAHLWDKFTWNVTQKKKGKQVYLGAYDDEEAAARAYDLAALKYWGTSTFTNFQISDYEKEIEIMQTATKEEYLASLRRKSSGFSRGASMYRGVARHHQNGRWEARIGRVFGNKYLYLGTYGTQEEAARAYDIAAIEYRGINAITNFDSSTYIRWLKPGANNSVPFQETEAITKSKAALSSLYSGIKLQSSCLPVKPCRINTMSMQEQYGRNVPFSSSKKTSSPTALGLLLRSSVFKELVEKNSNLSEDETDEETTKILQQSSYDDECTDFLYKTPFSHYSNNRWIELQG